MRRFRVEGHAEVGEDGEGHLVHDRDAVLHVGGEAGVAADGGQAVDGQRNLHIAQSGVGGVARHLRAVGVGQSEVHLGGNERVGRAGADVEAAHLVLAAAVDAAERRSHLPAVACNVGELHTVAQYVVALVVNAQTLHRVELPVGRGRRIVLGVAAHARQLEGDVQVPAVVRAHGAVQRGEAEARRHNRCDDAVQLVLPGDAGAEGQRLEDVQRVLVEGRNSGARQRVRESHARHA